MWSDLKVDNNYEIYSEYPYYIRNKSRKNNLNVYYNNLGYPQVYIKKAYLIHRLIAMQFLENDDPENKKHVIHINLDKNDYHLENLKWANTSESNTNRNKHKCNIQYIEELPKTTVKITYHKGYYFDSYYFDYESKQLIYETSTFKYKIVNKNKNDTEIKMKDINGKYHSFYWKTFVDKILERC